VAFSALLAGASSVGSIGKSLSSIGSVVGIKGSKDPGRLAGNARALQQVMQGGANLTFETQGVTALAFLLMKSPVSQGGQGGWATSLAQNDAWAKYQQAKAFLASQNGARPSATVSNALGIGNSGSQTGKPFPGSVAVAGAGLGDKTTGYVIVGVLILAALFLVRK